MTNAEKFIVIILIGVLAWGFFSISSTSYNARGIEENPCVPDYIGGCN